MCLGLLAGTEASCHNMACIHALDVIIQNRAALSKILVWRDLWATPSLKACLEIGWGLVAWPKRGQGLFCQSEE